jgi:hypothetical protein
MNTYANVMDNLAVFHQDEFSQDRRYDRENINYTPPAFYHIH